MTPGFYSVTVPAAQIFWKCCTSSFCMYVSLCLLYMGTWQSWDKALDFCVLSLIPSHICLWIFLPTDCDFHVCKIRKFENVKNISLPIHPKMVCGVLSCRSSADHQPIIYSVIKIHLVGSATSEIGFVPFPRWTELRNPNINHICWHHTV